MAKVFLSIPLTLDERRAIRHAAVERDMPVARLVRDLLAPVLMLRPAPAPAPRRDTLRLLGRDGDTSSSERDR